MAPLQCSCLENPTHGGAWWAAVHGLQSRTHLSVSTLSLLGLHLVSPQHVSELTQAMSVSRERQGARLRQQMLVSPASGSWSSETEQVTACWSLGEGLPPAASPLGRLGACLLLLSRRRCPHGAPTLRPPRIHVTPRYHHIELYLGLQHINWGGAGTDVQSVAVRALQVRACCCRLLWTKLQPLFEFPSPSLCPFSSLGSSPGFHTVFGDKICLMSV